MRTERIRVFFLALWGVSHFVLANAAADSGERPLGPGHTQKGAAVYQQYCAACHGEDLSGGGYGPSLLSKAFLQRWQYPATDKLNSYVQQQMPLGQGGLLNDEQVSEVLSYMFAQAERLLSLGRTQSSAEKAAVETTYIPPPPDPRPSPLSSLTPVSDAMLVEPPASDWLMWRRTYDAKAFSPLANITPDNVKHLNLAWAWSLPSNRHIAPPLVHEGVMFVYSEGDTVQALDAASGDLLWRYQRQFKGKTARYGLRAIGIYRNTLIVPTDDGNILALDVKTGETVWDQSIVDPAPFRFSGGPLIADGKILIGTSTGRAPGRNFIVALDAARGEELWRFDTVPKTGDVGGETWNLLDDSERSGAGVWFPGGYDPETKLTIWGTGNTYNPEPLRELSEGAVSNDGLFTNTTLALDVNTGERVWHFQHLRNDQWNYDWAYERTLATIPIAGKETKVVITAGKQALFDVLRRDNGAYLFSFDMGLQNTILSINPVTGAKTIDPNALPSVKSTRFLCPSAVGGRRWHPSAYSEKFGHTLLVPYGESCMKMRLPQLGDYAHGRFGQRRVPLPDSDGRFGGLQAIDIANGDVKWTHRRRTPPSTGVLATAGELVFAGWYDRFFTAFDINSGELVWKSRLTTPPTTSPISYAVDGKQFVAVVSSGYKPAPQVAELSDADNQWFFPREITGPQSSNATVWVFSLGDP